MEKNYKKPLEEFGKDEGIINYNNPNCEDCNSCCSMSASISESELDIILMRIKTDGIFLNRIKNKIIELNDSYKEGIINFKCLFTTEKYKKCLIYDIRPTVCSEFHCGSNTEVDLNNKKYTIINVLNYVVNKYMPKEKEFKKLLDVYLLAYRQFIENAFKEMGG